MGTAPLKRQPSLTPQEVVVLSSCEFIYLWQFLKLIICNREIDILQAKVKVFPEPRKKSGK
jgi:hypothetical protein